MVERLLHCMLAHSMLKIGGNSDVELSLPLDDVNEPVAHRNSIAGFR